MNCTRRVWEPLRNYRQSETQSDNCLYEKQAMQSKNFQREELNSLDIRLVRVDLI